jgi:hypothetical protein
MVGFLWEMAVPLCKDFNNLKTCDNINSGASSEPVLSDSLSQVLETLCYLDAIADFQVSGFNALTMT